jgi:hypothetical protein
MKYIFVAGAPGSKWSGVVKNIYHSSSVDQSDYTPERTYWNDANGTKQLMHFGAYFDPGMEFGDWFNNLSNGLGERTKAEHEAEFDRPFSGTGVRIIKSHWFSYRQNIEYLRKTWPECPVVLVHRPDDACLGWWVRAGHFDITYPDYKGYGDLRSMAKIIEAQNTGIQWANDRLKPHRVYNNTRLALILGLAQPPEQYKQSYTEQDIQVSVLI